MLGKCDIDARVAAGWIGKLDKSQWKFLRVMLKARLQRLQRLQHGSDVKQCAYPWHDKLQTSYCVHMSYDAAVTYRFYQFGFYARLVDRHYFSGQLIVQHSWQKYHLHGNSNKYSCHAYCDSSSGSDSDTDMED